LEQTAIFRDIVCAFNGRTNNQDIVQDKSVLDHPNMDQTKHVR